MYILSFITIFLCRCVYAILKFSINNKHNLYKDSIYRICITLSKNPKICQKQKIKISNILK